MHGYYFSDVSCALFLDRCRVLLYARERFAETHSSATGNVPVICETICYLMTDVVGGTR
jgi:hypothetical protein